MCGIEGVCLSGDRWYYYGGAKREETEMGIQGISSMNWSFPKLITFEIHPSFFTLSPSFSPNPQNLPTSPHQSIKRLRLPQPQLHPHFHFSPQSSHFQSQLVQEYSSEYTVTIRHLSFHVRPCPTPVHLHLPLRLPNTDYSTARASNEWVTSQLSLSFSHTFSLYTIQVAWQETNAMSRTS